MPYDQDNCIGIAGFAPGTLTLGVYMIKVTGVKPEIARWLEAQINIRQVYAYLEDCMLFEMFYGEVTPKQQKDLMEKHGLFQNEDKP